MLRFSRIPRLPERMATLTFLGNFPETAQLLMPVWAGRAGRCGLGRGGGRGSSWPGDPRGKLGRLQLTLLSPCHPLSN